MGNCIGKKYYTLQSKTMPNIPPLVTHMTANDFGNNPSGRPLFVATQDVSGGNITGGVTNLGAADEYLSVTSDGDIPTQGNVTITNLGVLSISAGVGINISTGLDGTYQVSISGTNLATKPHVTLATNVPYLFNQGTTISSTNFPSQTQVPVYAITTASAYNYCEMHWGFVPRGGDPVHLSTSNDIASPFSFYVTPSLGIAAATNISNCFWSFTTLDVQNENTTLIPYTGGSFISTAEVLQPTRKMTAWSSDPSGSSNWYLVGYNSSPNASPVPYLDIANTNTISVNAFLWNTRIS